MAFSFGSTMSDDDLAKYQSSSAYTAPTPAPAPVYYAPPAPAYQAPPAPAPVYQAPAPAPAPVYTPPAPAPAVSGLFGNPLPTGVAYGTPTPSPAPAPALPAMQSTLPTLSSIASTPTASKSYGSYLDPLLASGQIKLAPNAPGYDPNNPTFVSSDGMTMYRLGTGQPGSSSNPLTGSMGSEGTPIVSSMAQTPSGWGTLTQTQLPSAYNYNVPFGTAVQNLHPDTGQVVADQSMIEPDTLPLGGKIALGLIAAMTGGAAAAGMGAAGSAAGGMVGDSTAAGYGGLDAASTTTMGGGASVGGGSSLGSIASGLGDAGSLGGAVAAASPGASSAATDLAGQTMGQAAPAYTTAAADSQLANTQLGITGSQAASDAASAAIPSVTVNGAPSTGLLDSLGLGSGTNVLGSTSIPTSGLGSVVSALTGGGSATGSGSSSSTSGGLGNMSLSDIANIANGIYGAQQQSQAAATMKAWMDSQMGQINNLYAPNSPEYNQLWNQMSAKDAAAGRNSQYGVRSVDFAGKVAQAKADDITKLTGLLASPYEKALTQGSTAAINATSPIIKALQSSGGSVNLSSLISALGGNSNTASSLFGSIPTDTSGLSSGSSTIGDDSDIMNFIDSNWGLA